MGTLVLGWAIFTAWRGYSTGQRGEPSAPGTPEVTGAPRLKTDREAVDLGDVRLGKTVEASFELRNVGDRTLRFTELPYIEVVEGC